MKMNLIYYIHLMNYSYFSQAEANKLYQLSYKQKLVSLNRQWQGEVFLARIVMAKFCSFSCLLAISWALVNANLLLLLLALSIIGTEFRMHLADHNHNHRATQIKASAPHNTPLYFFFVIRCPSKIMTEPKSWP